MAAKTSRQMTSLTFGEVVVDAQSGFASGTRSEFGAVQLRMNNVRTDGSLDWSEFIRVPATAQQIAKYSLQVGDVLFNSTNSLELVGKSSLFHGFPEPVVLSNHFLRIRVNEKLADPTYIGWWLHLQWRHRVFESMATTWINQAAVRKDELFALPIALPPLSEQHRLAAVLDKADHIRRLRRYALKLGDGLLQSMFGQKFGEISSNDTSWSFLPLDQISEIASGVTKGQHLGGQKTVSVPYLRVANVQAGYMDLSDIKTIDVLQTDAVALRLLKGDILMTEGGDFDKLGRGALWSGEIENCIHQNHIFRVRLDQSFMAPEIFEQFLQSSFAKTYFLRASKQTTNLATINMTQLKQLPVPIFPTELQASFIQQRRRFRRLQSQQEEGHRQADALLSGLLTSRCALK